MVYNHSIGRDLELCKISTNLMSRMRWKNTNLKISSTENIFQNIIKFYRFSEDVDGIFFSPLRVNNDKGCADDFHRCV